MISGDSNPCLRVPAASATGTQQAAGRVSQFGEHGQPATAVQQSNDTLQTPALLTLLRKQPHAACVRCKPRQRSGGVQWHKLQHRAPSPAAAANLTYRANAWHTLMPSFVFPLAVHPTTSGSLCWGNRRFMLALAVHGHIAAIMTIHFWRHRLRAKGDRKVRGWNGWHG